jgi:hypothetical protein
MASEKFDFAEFLAHLEAKRAALDALIDSYRAALSVGALGPVGDVDLSAVSGGAGIGSKPSGPVDLPQGALLGKSIPEGIKLILAAARRKVPIKEITAALREGGIESTSRFFENTVSTALHRLKTSGQVLKFNDGWALAEFYPENLRNRLAAAQAEQKTPKKPKARKRARKQARVITLPTAEKPQSAVG